MFKRSLFAALLGSALLAGPVMTVAPLAHGADAKASKADAEDKGDKKDDDAQPPLPDDKSVSQTIQINGKTITYTATVGKILVRDAKGKKIGEVVYTAYILPGDNANRPVTFAFNGGPGASSVYLNMGAVGPKHVEFGVAGDAPSDFKVTDNPNSWLDMTDLVFIDPIGTGYSRSDEDEASSKKDFYSTEADISYLSRVVYDWLVKNDRMRSPKYIMGESYGGYRAPRIAYALQTRQGVGVSGVVMVSPYLDPQAIGVDDALSPLPWMINLPSMAAGHLEREGKLTKEAMDQVEQYDRTQFVVDFLAGRADPAATQRLVSKVTDLTGLDPDLVRKLDGRVDIGTYLREAHRDENKIGSVYDSNVTAYDPFPGAYDQQSGDPILESIIAPTTSAMVDFVNRVVGWKTDAHYEALSYAVGEAWDRSNPGDKPVTELRKAIANDPHMGVLIAHGYNDLSCPFFTSVLVVNQMPSFGEAQRVKVVEYPGGHMFYARPNSSAAFKTDALALYSRH